MLRALTAKANIVGYWEKHNIFCKEKECKKSHTQIAESNIFEAIESDDEKKWAHMCESTDKYRQEFQRACKLVWQTIVCERVSLTY